MLPSEKDGSQFQGKIKSFRAKLGFKPNKMENLTWCVNRTLWGDEFGMREMGRICV